MEVFKNIFMEGYTMYAKFCEFNNIISNCVFTRYNHLENKNKYKLSLSGLRT